MSTTTSMVWPDPSAKKRQPRTSAAFVVRLLFGLIGIAGAVYLGIAQAEIREVEAATASWLVNSGLLGLHPAQAHGPTVLVHMSPTVVRGFTISPECTSAFLIAPLLALAGGMVIFRNRVSMTRIYCSAFLAATLLFAANQSRVVMIAEFVRYWGVADGYPLAHRVLGSLLILAALVFTYMTFFLLTCRRPRQLPDSGN
ncbi:hypothetical protein [Streptomyces lavendulocolor]|uniref:hypothetical protein n=1 Tax=Streptomyces lavendulocolor TaxID=67316 RepID=UPI0033CB049C